MILNPFVTQKAEQEEPVIEVSSSGLITATAGDKSATKQLTTQAAQIITPGTSNTTIASGKYLTGDQVVLGDTNLIPENIRSGVSIFDVAGSMANAETKVYSDVQNIMVQTIKTGNNCIFIVTVPFVADVAGLYMGISGGLIASGHNGIETVAIIQTETTQRAFFGTPNSVGVAQSVITTKSSNATQLQMSFYDYNSSMSAVTVSGLAGMGAVVYQ